MCESWVAVLEKDWREKRKIRKRDNIKVKSNINVTEWYSTLPADVQAKVEMIVNLLDDTPELSNETQGLAISKIHELIPEYPNLHWRHIRKELQDVSQKYYISKDYYSAFIEALKRYLAEVKKKSGMNHSDERSLIQAVFTGKKLSVTKKYVKTDGTPFDQKTIKNIEEGQFFLSEGIVVGGRHPLQHEEHIQ